MRLPFFRGKRVLAITPTGLGFGFCVFEGPLRPIDWGVKVVKKPRNVYCLDKIEELLDFYLPDVIVVEDCTVEGSRRSPRSQELVQDIGALASRRKISTYGYTRAQIREFFSHYDAVTKHQIAATIASWFPDLAHRLPRERKPWMSEDYSMPVFVAISLALTFFYFTNKLKRAA